MLFEVESAKSLEQIEADIRESAQNHKFGVLAVHDLQEKMQEKGLEMKRQVRIYEVCNPKQAKEVLDVNPQISTALPCRISVYSTDKGYTLSTIRPTAMMKAFAEEGVDQVAREVEDTIVAIMRESAG
jgi:uncharacterized protein (DUF302 family)